MKRVVVKRTEPWAWSVGDRREGKSRGGHSPASEECGEGWLPSPSTKEEQTSPQDAGRGDHGELSTHCMESAL